MLIIIYIKIGKSDIMDRIEYKKELVYFLKKRDLGPKSFEKVRDEIQNKLEEELLQKEYEKTIISRRRSKNSSK